MAFWNNWIPKYFLVLISEYLDIWIETFWQVIENKSVHLSYIIRILISFFYARQFRLKYYTEVRSNTEYHCCNIAISQYCNISLEKNLKNLELFVWQTLTWGRPGKFCFHIDCLGINKSIGRHHFSTFFLTGLSECKKWVQEITRRMICGSNNSSVSSRYTEIVSRVDLLVSSYILAKLVSTVNLLYNITTV